MKIENEIEDDETFKVIAAAQEKENNAIAGLHVQVLKHINRLEKIGGKQDYTHTITEVLKAFGGEATLSFLSQVMADATLFAEARKQLLAKGVIIELQEKNRKILKLAQAA